jgi:hypothetical protein
LRTPTPVLDRTRISRDGALAAFAALIAVSALLVSVLFWVRRDARPRDTHASLAQQPSLTATAAAQPGARSVVHVTSSDEVRAGADGRFHIAVLPAMATGEVRADGAGSFAISGLAFGEVELLAAASDRAARPPMATSTAITLGVGHVLRGRVLDAAGGGPVANAVVSIDGPEGARIGDCRTDELGAFEVTVPSDPVAVHAAVAGVGGSRFELVPPSRGTVELRLPETGRLDVTVTGPSTSGPVTVTATRTDPSDGGFRSFVLDRVLDRSSVGSTFQADVSPGEYVVHASPAPSRIALKSGDSRGDIAVAVAVGQTQKLSLAIEARSAASPRARRR